MRVVVGDDSVLRASGVGLAVLRRAPGVSSELVSSGYLGEVLEVCERKEGRPASVGSREQLAARAAVIGSVTTVLSPPSGPTIMTAELPCEW